MADKAKMKSFIRPKEASLGVTPGWGWLTGPVTIEQGGFGFCPRSVIQVTNPEIKPDVTRHDDLSLINHSLVSAIGTECL